MRITNRFIHFFLLAIAGLTYAPSFSQATIRVTVVSVQSLNYADCDGLFFGNSDFVWEFTATDNTIGYSNNNPALFGIFNFNYGYKNNDNGPYTMSSPNGGFSPTNGLFFDHDFLCPTTVPTSINLAWEAYENDDIGNYDILGLNDGQTGMQNVSMAVPAAGGSLNYTFNANSVDPSCNEQYRINLRVDRIPIVVNYLDDFICNATPVSLNTTYTFGWCAATLEPNEPAANDVQNAGSTWAKFIAPASGSVQVSTDLAGTQIGTYIEIYHASDGMNCTDGIHAVTGALIKNKFEYLSHVDFSDGIDFLGIDPESDITFDACDPIPLISYQKLIPGQTYYIQVTADNAGDHGYYQLRVNGLGGGAPNLEDIPCLSSPVAINTAAISSASNNSPSATLSFGCAFDGGNTAGETGQQHTSSNPNQYHAYDYQHIAANNPVMNESVWLNFIAPNQGRISYETDYQNALYGESAALFGFDKVFGPGVPNDYLCTNLKFIDSDEGGTNSFLGGDPSALINGQCLEPGYRYYGMVDPSDNITVFSPQNIKTWLFDPSIVDPTLNPPGNDILCLTMQNPLYQVPVILAGTNPTFQAVAGSNVLACREYLAGEPPIDPNPANCADQTVWHYFVCPPSGAVELSIRAYIGMNLLRFNIFELLNGTNCYGGLQPATFTTNGTRYSPPITPIASGSATFNGHQETMCCLDSGKIYAIQIDGGSPGDEGQYIIEYIKELESDAGDVFGNISNGEYVNITTPDTAFVCFGDQITPGILLDGNGISTASLPSCLLPGYVLHQTQPLPDPIANTGFTFIDSIQGLTGSFSNTGTGSGVFGDPLFNSVYFLSPAGDIPSNWGTFSCLTSTVETGIPVVFLQALSTNFNYNNTTCSVSFSASGGLNSFYNQPYAYTITNPLGLIAQSGSITPGQTINYTAAIIGVYTVLINDGACPQTYTFDATGCLNPCIPTTINIDYSICAGDSLYLEANWQSVPGVFTDTLLSVMGCDSIVVTNLSLFANPVYGFQEYTICQGESISVADNSYNSNGLYIDTLQTINGCDSILTTGIFVITPVVVNSEVHLCNGSSYTFNGTTYNSEGVYFDTISTVQGCDSVLVLSLFLNDTYEVFIQDTICLGDRIIFGIDTIYFAGSYQLPLVADNGCDSTINLLVNTIDCDLVSVYAPNSFTPDGDELNEIWMPIIMNVKSFEFLIYNRWGELVTHSYGEGWDGKYKGDDCPIGVYAYVLSWIDKDNLEHQVTGHITLIR
ncbi:MAG: gliding motility-associated C-terminal domain-containing protein [Flavobacteriia bacterium]|nr:gliding motility-associated C-terminal domain-containing protein [Flavobacteriia bacterium]